MMRIIPGAIFLLVSHLHCNSLFAAGSWFKTPSSWTNSKNSQNFSPEFGILKAGIFSKEGEIRWVIADLSAATLCTDQRPLYLWITHRLGKKEPLSEKAATKLGEGITKKGVPACVKGIEFDIEPLTEDRKDELLRFLAALKNTLPKNLELRLAFPPVSKEKIPGNTWNDAAAEQILTLVDGLDIMLYDSGLTKKHAYFNLLFENLTFLLKHPEKKFFMGLPGYPDKTHLHLGPEKISVLFTAIEKLPETTFCAKQLDWSFYAYTAMSVDELRLASKLQELQRKKCSTGS